MIQKIEKAQRAVNNMIARYKLPQIPKEQIRNFINYLKTNGVNCKAVLVSVTDLKPIQAHVNREKVNSIKTDADSAFKIPLLVSQEGLILDGHHRFLAKREIDPHGKLPCIMAECDIRELVKLGNQFEGSESKTVYETTIFGKHVFGKKDGEPNLELMIRKPLRPRDAP
jgi:hypothetical protein